MRKRFSLHRISSRIIIATSGVIVIIVIAVIILVTFQMNKLIESAERRELESIYREMRGELKSDEKLATALAFAVALQPSTAGLFADRNREALLREYLPVFNKMEEAYAVRQFQFHTAPARSFLRLHKPEKFSDDLSSFRHTVVLSNTEGKPVSGLEVGVAGLGIRGVVPVRSGNSQVGTVEFGLSFGKPFLEEFKKRYSVRQVELAFYLVSKDSGEFREFARTYGGDAFLQSDELKSIVSNDRGESESIEHGSAEQSEGILVKNISVPGGERALYAASVHDFSGKAIGVMEVSMDRDFYLAQLASSRIFLSLTGVIAVSIGIIISLFIGSGISRPIEAAVTRVRDIAEGEGDLTRRLSEDAKDETGELARWINRFIERIHTIVKEISLDTNMILSSANELTTESAKLTEQMSTTSDRAGSIASAATEMDHSFHTISRSIEDMRNSLEEIYRQSSAAASVAQEGDEKADQTSRLMVELEKEAKEVDIVTEAIMTITNQTNLLALNASIEAAGAGESGKGFAVVASEVKELAARASLSSEEIKGRVKAIQRSSENAGAAMTEIIDVIKEVNKINAEIAHSMSEYASKTREITASIQQSSTASEETARNIEEISGATQAGKQSADQLENLSNRLNELANNLNKIVRQFKV